MEIEKQIDALWKKELSNLGSEELVGKADRIGYNTEKLHEDVAFLVSKIIETRVLREAYSVKYFAEEAIERIDDHGI